MFNPQFPNQMPMQQGPVNNPMAQGPIPGPTNQPGPAASMQQMIFNALYNSNPNFREFANSMINHDPNQEFQTRGLDYSQYQNIDPNQIRNSFGL